MIYGLPGSAPQERSQTLYYTRPRRVSPLCGVFLSAGAACVGVTDRRHLLPDVALQHPEVRRPGTDRTRVGARHGARDLRDVGEVVHHPRCQQLSHRDVSELRVHAGEIEILWLEIPAAQRCDALAAQAIELLEQSAQRPR